MGYEQVKEKAAKALGEIDLNKPYGTELFDALARVTVSVAIEACAIRRNNNGEIEVFWRQRSMEDTVYPGEWHFPGSVMRPGETVKNVFRRLEKKEFGSLITSFVFVGNLNVPNSERGHFLSLVYLITLADDTECTETKGWFSVNSLPTPVVDIHENDLLPMVIETFLNKE